MGNPPISFLEFHALNTLWALPKNLTHDMTRKVGYPKVPNPAAQPPQLLPHFSTWRRRRLDVQKTFLSCKKVSTQKVCLKTRSLSSSSFQFPPPGLAKSLTCVIKREHASSAKSSQPWPHSFCSARSETSFLFLDLDDAFLLLHRDHQDEQTRVWYFNDFHLPSRSNQEAKS